jgi:hypothetical protein
MVEINFRPNERTLRQFGWIALAGFGALAVCAWQHWLVFRHLPDGAGAPVAAVLAALGALSALCSLVYPRANALLFVGLSLVAFPIGFVLSYVIMATLFYAVIAPVGFVMRLFGADPMERRMLPDAKTYWVEARPARAKADYFKQF